MGDSLDRWIDVLRDRVGRGDIDGLRPIDVGYGTAHLPGQITVRIMLADLDHLDYLDHLALESPDRTGHQERRRALVDDFRRLRALIG